MDLPDNLRQVRLLQLLREGKMAFVIFTRPDGSPVGIDAARVISFSPVPPLSSPLAGPLSQGTRIVFVNKTHQDVVELVDEVARRFKAAASEVIEAMMVRGTATRSVDTVTKPVVARHDGGPRATRAG